MTFLDNTTHIFKIEHYFKLFNLLLRKEAKILFTFISFKRSFISGSAKQEILTFWPFKCHSHHSILYLVKIVVVFYFAFSLDVYFSFFMMVQFSFSLLDSDELITKENMSSCNCKNTKHCGHGFEANWSTSHQLLDTWRQCFSLSSQTLL